MMALFVRTRDLRARQREQAMPIRRRLAKARTSGELLSSENREGDRDVRRRWTLRTLLFEGILALGALLDGEKGKML